MANTTPERSKKKLVYDSHSPSPQMSSLNPSDSSLGTNNRNHEVFSPHVNASSALLPHQNQGVTWKAKRSALRKTRTIVLLGAQFSGKTAICVRFVNERFEEASIPTYENSFSKLFKHRGHEVEVIIKDTQGLQGDQESFRQEYALGVHAYVLVYSVTSMRSFEIVRAVNQKLINLTGSSSVPRILVGNKCDERDRQVPADMGAALAAKWGVPFLECSAKFAQNVDRLFTTLLDEIEAQSEPSRGITASIEETLSNCFGFCRGSGWKNEIDDANMTASASPTPLIANSTTNSTSMSSSPPSLNDTRLERWGFFAKVCAWALMFASLGAIIAAVILGVRTSDSQFELLCYTLFGFSLIVWLVSLCGVYGLRISSTDFLSVYYASLVCLIVSEIGVWILLYIDMSIFASHTLLAVGAGVAAIILQTCAAYSAWTLSKLLEAALNLSNPSPPPIAATNEGYHQGYHSLYE